MPEGLFYRPEFVSSEEEKALVAQIGGLPLANFEYHAFTGKRRVLNFGWDYRFGGRELTPTEPVPAFLLPLRVRSAALAGVDPEDLEQALLTEYPPGSAIGWHRDLPMFGLVIGISLLGRCRFRLRRHADAGWQRATLLLEPRSAYVLDGAVRREWQHSIPPSEELRYSITFRTLRKRRPNLPKARG